MDTCNTPSRVYENLSLHKDRFSTRLLTIFPGKPQEDIKCKLNVVNITAETHYYALSYVWGDLTQRRSISVNGKRFFVTFNLEEALRAIRHETKRMVLWADAVCINQCDLDERAAQIKEMGAVFNSAYQVLIWLGSGDAYTDAAFECMKSHEEREPAIISKYVEQRFSDRVDVVKERLGRTWLQRGVEKILTRTWWTRVWVVQELARAAGDPLLGCGREWVQWSLFVKFCGKYEFGGSIRHRLVERVWEMQTMREEVRWPPRLRDFNAVGVFDDDLSVWLRRTAMFDATDPRDKLFALLGLARSRLWQMIDIDYRKSTSELRWNLFSQIAKERINLDILLLCRPLKAQGMPSWLPSLEAAEDTMFRSGVVEFSTQLSREQRTCGGTHAKSPFEEDAEYNEYQVPEREYMDYWKTEYLRLCSKTHSRLERSWLLLLERRKAIQALHHETTLCSIKNQRLYLKGIRVGKVSKIVSKSRQALPRTGSITKESYLSESHLEQWCGEEAVSKIQARRGEQDETLNLTRMAVLYQWMPIWRAVYDRHQTPDDEVTFDQSLTGFGQKSTLGLYNHRRIVDAIGGRSQFVTDTGLVGLGPSDLMENDEVVLFFTSSFAFVLRADCEHHRLVGAAAVSAPRSIRIAVRPEGRFPNFLREEYGVYNTDIGSWLDLTIEQSTTVSSWLDRWDNSEADNCPENSLRETETREFIII